MLMKNIFHEGAISPDFIANSIAKHSTKKDIGAHAIFLGQVRADEMEGKKVIAIEYTSNLTMALETMHAIREDIFSKYALTCLHVHHSLGKVLAGEICLFVFASSRHRKDATHACSEIVERIKATLPVWGKEILDDNAYRWKENS